MSDLPTGVYEQLLTEELVAQLDGLRHVSQQVGDSEAPGTLGDHVAQALVRALADLPADERVSRANAVLAELGSSDRIVAGPQQLLAVARQEESGVAPAPDAASCSVQTPRGAEH